ncbi:GIY-YIG nuclease family protein, partial [Massilia sp. CCM 8734]|uniref:GIY-YIG nuclease family protein n=1 Tax=Massilia sp. CCM 8734 TaxID=2609283 RepID=UPI001AAE2D62
PFDAPFNRVGHPLPATIENTADEVSYRPASNALAVHETFRLVPGAAQEVNLPDEEIETESLEKLEAGIGRLYVLGTSLYTKGGEEIVKIGITTGTVENRISQLYTTGVPFRFRVMKDIETKNYYELEQSLHKLLDPYRINRSREFFTEKCLPFVDKVVAIHNEIHSGLQEG